MASSRQAPERRKRTGRLAGAGSGTERGIDPQPRGERLGHGRLRRDLEQAGLLLVAQRLRGRESPIDVLHAALVPTQTQPDRDLAELPPLAAGVHPERDRTAGPETREQQL